MKKYTQKNSLELDTRIRESMGEGYTLDNN